MRTLAGPSFVSVEGSCCVWTHGVGTPANAVFLERTTLCLALGDGQYVPPYGEHRPCPIFLLPDGRIAWRAWGFGGIEEVDL